MCNMTICRCSSGIEYKAGTAEARNGESIFAASNSSLLIGPDNAEIFVTGGASGLP